MCNPFRYFNSSPEVNCLAVMVYIRYPIRPRMVFSILKRRDQVRQMAISRRWESSQSSA